MTTKLGEIEIDSVSSAELQRITQAWFAKYESHNGILTYEDIAGFRVFFLDN